MKKPKKKILFFGIGLGGAGAQRQLVNIITALNPHKYDIHILIRENDTRFLEPREMEFKIISLFEPGGVKNHLFMTIKEIITFINVVRKYNIDIVYARGYPFYWKAGLIKRLMRNRFNLISVEATYLSEALVNRPRTRRWIVRRLCKAAILSSDIVYCLTEASKESLVNAINVSPEKVNIFPGLFNRADFQDIPLVENYFDDDYFNIICLGRFVSLKNHLFLIESFNQLACNNCRLYLIGGGGLEEEYNTRINQLGLTDHVFIRPFSTEAYSLMKGCDLVVFPSLYEGFGNVLFESILCETPIITTDFKGIDRQIRQYMSDIGLLVELGNKEDMVEKINYVKNNYNDVKKEIKKLCEIVSEEFSLRKYIEVFEAQLDKID